MANGDRTSPRVALAAVLALLLLVGALWALVVVDFRQASAGDSSAAASTTSSPTSSTTSSTSSPTRAEGEWSIGDARKAVPRDGSRTLVLGDSTGDGYDEWVHLWAKAEGLPIATGRSEAESGYESESPETRVWSGSAPDATAAYPVERSDEIWPSVDPGLVVLSFGHAQESPDEATKQLEALRVDIADRVEQAPIVVLLQNPSADDADADMREAIAARAEEAGLPTIDIATAFEDSGMPKADLRLDAFHPSGAGSQLWAETVAKALG
ncbi:SGNH/GDSL hydrolase family protein [Janibacter limosus]|uniref:SGNH/GDSL hydrolase family protein n=1 Tax=Janibacter limosus TaxID=53458 RepID=UPI0035D5AC56|nr:SGNH/GDSL hydrolase family protein [Janibacter limosus]